MFRFGFSLLYFLRISPCNMRRMDIAKYLIVEHFKCNNISFVNYFEFSFCIVAMYITVFLCVVFPMQFIIWCYRYFCSPMFTLPFCYCPSCLLSYRVSIKTGESDIHYYVVFTTYCTAFNILIDNI